MIVMDWDNEILDYVAAYGPVTRQDIISYLEEQSNLSDETIEGMVDYAIQFEIEEYDIPDTYWSKVPDFIEVVDQQITANNKAAIELERE